MNYHKWPKKIEPLSPSQKQINDDFMKHWLNVLASKEYYRAIERFNHGYPVKHAPKDFISSLEIGAGLGKHLIYEKLSHLQKQNYLALDLRRSMIDEINRKFPGIKTHVADCQSKLPFKENNFDRILAIHVLEHLPNLPVAIKEMHRLCNKEKGVLTVVIPCEGGFVHSLARRISAKRIFEKRYKQSYDWFIKREHINRPKEILEELRLFFKIIHSSYFPLKIPIIHMNLCMGITLKPLINKRDF